MPADSGDESILSVIIKMLQLASGAERLFPATILYNEGWLLRLVIDWFSRQPPSASPLSFEPGARWYSEALLRSQFLPRHQRDKRAEGWTHADAVIGHLTIGQGALANCELQDSATQFVVIEAKLGSPLSAGVTNAPWFDQAARNVACIAEILCCAKKCPETMSKLQFIVAAPEAHVSAGIFAKELTLDSIREKVVRRVHSYEEADKPAKVVWLREWFEPTLERIVVESRTWESILADITESEPNVGLALQHFYALCLKFNPLRSGTATALLPGNSAAMR